MTPHVTLIRITSDIEESHLTSYVAFVLCLRWSMRRS